MARPRLKAVGMAERFPSGPSTARNPWGVVLYDAIERYLCIPPFPS